MRYSSLLKFYAILLGSILLNCSFVTTDEHKIKSSSWQSLKSDNDIEIKYRYADCDLPSYGTHNENVYLQITNKTDKKIQLEWNVEYWYNNKCSGCESGNLENHKIIKLNPHETIQGSCSEKCDPSLLIFSKMLNTGTKSELTDFNLRDIKVTSIVK
jgi:uncharacterized protein YcfL